MRVEINNLNETTFVQPNGDVVVFDQPPFEKIILSDGSEALSFKATGITIYPMSIEGEEDA